MACIDKTYSFSYKEYKELKDWAFGKSFEGLYGSIYKPSRSIFSLLESDFMGREMPVMLTSKAEDYFLIKYCPIKFVQDRLKSVYSKEYYDSVKNGTSEFDHFSKDGRYGTKVTMLSSPKKIFKLNNNKPLSWGRRKNNKWWVQIIEPEEYNYMSYADDKYWVWPNELYLDNGISNTAHCKTIKALKRKIRNWKLPKGTIVRVMGNLVYEEYKFLVK